MARMTGVIDHNSFKTKPGLSIKNIAERQANECCAQSLSSILISFI